MNRQGRLLTQRTLYLSALAAALGIVAGGAAWLLVRLIGVITNLALLHRWGSDLPSLRNYHPGVSLVLVAVAAGGLGSLPPRGGAGVQPPGPPHARGAAL